MTVSIVVPAYNVARWLPATIESVLAQTYGDWELIIVDDGSCDGTSAIAEAYVCRDRRVRLIRKSNGGLSSARNAGMSVASGEYIAFLDADDIWLPRKLEQQVKCLASYDNYGACYTWTEIIDQDGNVIEDWGMLKKTYWHDPVIAHDLAGGNFVSGSGSGVLMRRSLVARVGYFDETMRAAEDLDYWYRLALSVQFCLVHAVLVQIRRHSTSMQSDIIRVANSNIDFVRKAQLIAPSDHLLQLARLEARALFTIFWHYVRQRQPRPALHAASNLLRHYPLFGVGRIIRQLSLVMLGRMGLIGR